MKFYRNIITNEIIPENYLIQDKNQDYKLIETTDKHLIIDEYGYPTTLLRNERLDILFQQKFEEHLYEKPDLSKFTQLRTQMERCDSFVDMWRLIQDLSRLIMQFQYEE